MEGWCNMIFCSDIDHICQRSSSWVDDNQWADQLSTGSNLQQQHHAPPRLTRQHLEMTNRVYKRLPKHSSEPRLWSCACACVRCVCLCLLSPNQREASLSSRAEITSECYLCGSVRNGVTFSHQRVCVCVCALSLRVFVLVCTFFSQLYV